MQKTIHVPDDLLAKVDNLLVHNGLSFNAFVNSLIRQSVIRKVASPDAKAEILAWTGQGTLADLARRLDLSLTAVTNVRKAAGLIGRSRKLTADQVRAIRASTDKQESLAAEYGVSQSRISQIKNGAEYV